MKRPFRMLTLGLPLLLGGCITNHYPPADTGFRRITSLAELQGCYRNAGESSPKASPSTLSQTLWLDTAEPDHKQIDRIQVEVAGEGQLKVTAFTASAPVFTRIHALGKDLEWQEGQLRFTRRIGSVPTEPGNVFLGVASEEVRLGLDAAGHGRTESTLLTSGTLFLIIPLAGRFHEVVRYRRLSSACEPATAP